MRIYLQFLLGILAAVLGWSFTQLLIVDLAPIWKANNFTFFLEHPYVVKLIILTIFLAIGMVISEIFLSHPTRIKAGLRVVKKPLFIAIILGILVGLFSSGIRLLIDISPASAFFVNSINWIIIGGAVGFAEATSWSFRLISREKLEFDTIRNRVLLSSMIGGTGGLIVFLLSETFVKQEILSFLLLGGVLGISLSLIPSPTSHPVLKAGYGFEATKTPTTWSAKIKYPLTFTNHSREKKIEEGLSIELPTKKENLPPEKEILIGSNSSNSHIYVSDLPQDCAKIFFKGRQAWIEPCGNNDIKVTAEQIEIQPSHNMEDADQSPERLRHNQIITLYVKPITEETSEAESEETSELFPTQSTKSTRKYVRFVFYDRFLDPEA